MESAEKKIDYLLGLPESQVFDCKRAQIKPAKIIETICAFANTDGGVIALGMEDPKKAPRNERLIGISEGIDNAADILNALDKEFEPPLFPVEKQYLDIVNTENQKDKILLLIISKGEDIHSLKNGDTFRRDGNKNHKMGASEITRLRYEKGSLKYEDEKATGVGLDDLNLEMLAKYKTDTNSQNTEDWQFLKDNGLATCDDNKWVLYKSAILLFGKNPAVTLKSKTSIKISHYYGKSRNYSGDPNFVIRPFTIEGCLLNQIQQAMYYYRKVVRESPPKLVGASFLPTILIPEWAFQEAVTNAVIHRNYFLEDDIQIRFFDDRIEIESPGAYPGYITPQNIRSERFARNPMLQRTLNRFNDAPNLDIGEGVDRIFKVMSDNNLYEPRYSLLSEKPNSVLLTLYNMQKIEYWDTVSNYLDNNLTINNQETREITGIQDTPKVSRLLRKWVDDGLLERVESGYKGDIYYKKPGIIVPLDK